MCRGHALYNLESDLHETTRSCYFRIVQSIRFHMEVSAHECTHCAPRNIRIEWKESEKWESETECMWMFYIHFLFSIWSLNIAGGRFYCFQCCNFHEDAHFFSISVARLLHWHWRNNDSPLELIDWNEMGEQFSNQPTANKSIRSKFLVESIERMRIFRPQRCAAIIFNIRFVQM